MTRFEIKAIVLGGLGECAAKFEHHGGTEKDAAAAAAVPATAAIATVRINGAAAAAAVFLSQAARAQKSQGNGRARHGRLTISFGMWIRVQWHCDGWVYFGHKEWCTATAVGPASTAHCLLFVGLVLWCRKNRYSESSRHPQFIIRSLLLCWLYALFRGCFNQSWCLRECHRQDCLHHTDSNRSRCSITYISIGFFGQPTVTDSERAPLIGLAAVPTLKRATKAVQYVDA